MWCGRNPMDLIEKYVIVPKTRTPTAHRRLFLSNLDLTHVTYVKDLPHVTYFEVVTFFDPPPSRIKFPEVCHDLRQALECILVKYHFLAGRLVPALEDGRRLEIECNDAGVVFVTAKADFPMKDLGDLWVPKEEYKQLVKFLHEKEAESVELKKKPLMLLQLTQFKCGGLAFAFLCNHCALDLVATRDFLRNLAAATHEKKLVIEPNPDRTIFQAQSPTKPKYKHYEYPVKPTDRGNDNNPPRQSLPHNVTRLIHLSSGQISNLKKEANQDCTSFHVVAAKIWKARTMAMKLPDETISKMLFPVDVREIKELKVPKGFVGNALVHGYARNTVSKLKKAEFLWLVVQVKEGLRRINDEYVRSGIDWLEVNKGVLDGDESFSVVDWQSLGIEEYKWGKVKCFAPITIMPGLVILLPGNEAGGMNICLELPSDQMQEFSRLMEV